MEIRNTYLVRIWYVLTLVRTKYVFASLNTPFGTYLVRICFSKYVLRIFIAYFRFFIAYFSLGYNSGPLSLQLRGGAPHI